MLTKEKFLVFILFFIKYFVNFYGFFFVFLIFLKLFFPHKLVNIVDCERKFS